MLSGMSARSELSSMSTALQDLTDRLGGIIASLQGPEREALEVELAEVERALDAARRRLARVVNEGGPGRP
jgi:hypothetical protein